MRVLLIALLAAISYAQTEALKRTWLELRRKLQPVLMTGIPTSSPTLSSEPTMSPITSSPSVFPSLLPSRSPSYLLSSNPTSKPSVGYKTLFSENVDSGFHYCIEYDLKSSCESNIGWEFIGTPDIGTCMGTKKPYREVSWFVMDPIKPHCNGDGSNVYETTPRFFIIDQPEPRKWIRKNTVYQNSDCTGDSSTSYITEETQFDCSWTGDVLGKSKRTQCEFDKSTGVSSAFNMVYPEPNCAGQPVRQDLELNKCMVAVEGKSISIKREAKCELSSMEADISLKLSVAGVTSENADSVCDSVAHALDGDVSYCSLEGPAKRRRLDDQSLYMNVDVENVNSAQSKLESSDFTSTLQDLPDGASVSGVTVSKISSATKQKKEDKEDSSDEDHQIVLIAGVTLFIVALWVYGCYRFNAGDQKKEGILLDDVVPHSPVGPVGPDPRYI